MKKIITLAITTLSLSLTTTAFAGSSKQVSGIAHVIDGDTLRVGSTKVRLHGIDAPELKQTCSDSAGNEYACGMTSRSVMKQIVGSKLTCKVLSNDRYGRAIAKCFNKNDQDIGAVLVREGWATAYTYFSKDYVKQEAAAKRERAGMHSGFFEDPYTYRKKNK